MFFFFFQAEDGIRDAQESRGLGDVYKRQATRPFDERIGRTPMRAAVLANRDPVDEIAVGVVPVSYTHLTLPTIYSV